MAQEERLPCSDRRRQEIRDAKLLFREELHADRTGARKRLCPCNICMGQSHSMRFRSVVAQHLKVYGRHPYHRGSSEELPIRNTLYVMHIERNVSDNMLRHLFGEKDTLECRRDMAQANKMHHFHLVIGPSKDYVKPKAPYTFTGTEKVDFIPRVSGTLVPSGFNSTLTKHIGERRLMDLKSHDHHILIQQILSAVVRNSLTRGVRETIIRLGNLFQRICAKVIRVSEISPLRTCAVEVLCLLEVHFPPRFFDIMTHLVVHLVDEVEICGPVHARWCYSVERYLDVLTKYVRDKSKLEAGMATGYMIDESLGFCTEYFELYEHCKSRVWDPQKELKDSEECLLGKPKPKLLTERELDRIHDYVIKHFVHTEELFGEWTEQKRLFKLCRQEFANSHRRPSGMPIQYPADLDSAFPKFSSWLNEHVRDLKDAQFPVSTELESLHCLPSQHGWAFNAMWAYGAHFFCNPETRLSTVAFDSGIAAIPPLPLTQKLM